MITETYEIQETTGQGVECDEQAMAIIERMSLTNQVTEQGGRRSFDYLTSEQQFVLNWLFPESSEISEYAAGGIPLRVLELYEKHHGDYEHWVVRHAPPAQVVDPVLLAFDGYSHKCYSRIDSNDISLIARWGDALLPWPELVKKATEMCQQVMRRQLALMRAKITTDIDMLEAGHKPERDEVSEYSSIFGRGW